MKRKSTIRTPVEELGKKETIGQYNAVLMEDLKSKMDLVIEGMEGTRESLQQQIGEFSTEVNERFSLVDTVLKQHSSDIKSLRTEMRDMEKRLSDKIDDIGNHVDDHETRTTKLETVHT